MNIRLHKNATTTPRIRALIQASDEPQTVLAQGWRYEIDEAAKLRRVKATDENTGGVT